jgi:hypothetical protein
MDDIIDNFPNSKSKKNYGYLESDEEFPDKRDSGDIFDRIGGTNHQGSFFGDMRQPANPFDQRPDEYNDIPRGGLESLEDSFDNMMYMGERSTPYNANF